MEWFKKIMSEVALRKTIGVLTALALLTPAFVSSTSFYTFSLPRVSVFHLLVELMVVVWVLLVIQHPSYRPSFKNPLILAVTIFVGSLLITIPFSSDPLRSFFSTANRAMGGFHYLHFYVWFLILATTMRSWKDWKPVLILATGVASVISLLSVFQWMMSPASFRPFATLGNPMFLGSFLIAPLFLGFILATREQDRVWRRYFYATSIVMLGGMAVSFSRGAILGVLFGVFVFFLLSGLLTAEQKTRRRMKEVALIFVLVCAVGFAWIRSDRADQIFGNHSGFITNRLFSENIGESRLELWSIAWDGFLKRPIAGWGIDQFEVSANLLMDQAGRDRLLTEHWYDRTHNEYLERLVTTGAIGGLGFLAFIVLLFLTLIRYIRSSIGEDQRVYILFIALFAAQAVELTFSFMMPSTGLVFFFVLAYATSLTVKPSQEHAPSSVNQSFLLGVAVLSLLVLALVAYQGTIKPYVNFAHGTKAYALLLKDPERAYALFSSVFKDHMYREELRLLLSDGIRPMVESKPRPEIIERFMRLEAEQMQQGVLDRPYDFRTSILAAESWRQLGERDHQAYETARYFADRSIALAPHRFEGYALQGHVALSEERWTDAIDLYNQSLSRTLLSADSGFIKTRLAEVYLATNDITNMYNELGAAEMLGYAIHTDIPFAKRLGGQFDPETVDKAWAVDYIDHAWRYTPQNTDILQARANIHRAVGDDVTADVMEQIIASFGVADVAPASEISK